jgi:hypothetical protein
MDPASTVKPTVPQDPVVTTWRNYTNDEYNFAMDVPSDWNEQAFSPSQPQESKGGTQVAFSPNPLPCETCSYFYDGYFSVKVYTQKSDAASYTNFVQKMNNIGKSAEYQGIILDGIKGVMTINTISAENHGYVYEISLDLDKGHGKIADSLVFRHAVNSFKFTYLLFNN